MSLFEDLKPYFQAARMFGFAPYSLSSADITLSKTAVAYSGICSLCYVYLLYIRLEILASSDSDVEAKLRFLTILRTVLSQGVILVDIFVCIRWHHKLQASLASMQKYDTAVVLEPTHKANAIRCWIGLSLTAAYFLVLGWLTYVYETSRPLESSMVYVVIYMSTTFGIIKFAAIVVSLLHRFRHLNRLLRTGWSRGQLHLRDAWYLHGYLVAAAEELNSLYSAQLLLWIAALTFNVISRIYVICETDGFPSVVKVFREGGIAAAFVFMLTVLAGVCHMTAAEESIQIGLYFLFHQFNFSAASGFLQVDLALLQTIAGTMTTYLVILKAPG